MVAGCFFEALPREKAAFAIIISDIVQFRVESKNYLHNRLMHSSVASVAPP
jgi:hypothetical protein